MNNSFDWKIDLQQWLRTYRDVSPELTRIIITFFEYAFNHTHCPQRAWFGIHSSRTSLVVGGLYLAAIQRSGQDQGLWLLVDQQHPIISDVKYQPVKATQKSIHPLIWAHSTSLPVIAELVASVALWDSFAVASKKVLVSSIANDRDAVQERWHKKRLSEFWTEPHGRINSKNLFKIFVVTKPKKLG